MNDAFRTLLLAILIECDKKNIENIRQMCKYAIEVMDRNE
jgi:hypothetical protein